MRYPCVLFILEKMSFPQIKIVYYAKIDKLILFYLQ